MKQITVIDLGSNKISAAAAVIDKNAAVKVLALENSESRGMTEGHIIDINKSVEDISAIVKRLEKRGKKRLRRVFITTRMRDVRLHRARGLAPLSKTSRTITRADVKKCLNTASMIRLPVDRIIVQTAVKGFYIDGSEHSVKNPVGLYGMKLEAEAFIISAKFSAIQNITKCVDHAGFLLEGIYHSSIASASGVLSDEELEKGTLLLDVGDDQIEALTFKNGALKDFSHIKKGANVPLTKPERRSDFSSVVLTGGGALADGAVEEAEKVFGAPARIGLAGGADRELSPQDAVMHTPTLGLIDCLAKEYAASHAAGDPLKNAIQKLSDIYETYF